MPQLNSLKKNILNHKAKIGIIGLGYVGLPLALEFAKAGFQVLGLDTDSYRTDNVNSGRSYIPDVQGEVLKELVKGRRLRASRDFRDLKGVQVIIICVPTPLRKTKEPDISHILSALENIVRSISSGRLVVLESTTYPGTTEEVILPALEKSGLKVGRDIALVFSPERIDPGNKRFNTSNIPKVVGGVTVRCTGLAKALYQQIVPEVISVSSPKAAEMVKLLENTFRSVNIGMANELALMCNRLKVDVWEVIEAAATKPFGYMPFYPGPGLGGHCLGEDEYIFVKFNGILETMQIKDFEHRVTSKGLGQILKADGITLINPHNNVEILSFNLESKRPCYQGVRHFFVRRYSGLTVKIRTVDNRLMTLTDKHPHLIYNGKLKIKFARDIKKGDRVLVLAKDVRPSTNFALKIDLIERLKDGFDYKVRVKPVGFKWLMYKRQLIPYLRKIARNYNYKDYFKNNFIPLEVFLAAENKLSLKRENLLLCTGKGSSYQEINAVIKIDHDFCRLVGYYLSEGCITADRSLRVRFSFNRNETEFIDDVRRILNGLRLSCSVYKSKKWMTDCIKVSSDLFGFLIRDILDCGTNSYTMKIPGLIFNLPASFKQEVLSGLLRGDGSVDIQNKMRTYEKRGHIYRHQFNAACVEYFTSSPVLFHQVVLLSQQLGLIPTIKVKNKHLRFFGYRNLNKILPLFIGEKREKLEKYFSRKQRNIREKSYRLNKNFALVKVSDVEICPIDGNVYSVEVEDTNTFVSSYGIITHNCIPIDPIYLSWKAKLHGFEARFIDLASQVNSYMPHYVVDRLADSLNEKGKAVHGSRILLVGVAYKKDVTDMRESPALEIIEFLKEKGARISYHDPYVPVLKTEDGKLRSIKLSEGNIRMQDAVVIVTNHTNLDYRFILSNSRLILDTRNALKSLPVGRCQVVKL